MNRPIPPEVVEGRVQPSMAHRGRKALVTSGARSDRLMCLTSRKKALMEQIQIDLEPLSTAHSVLPYLTAYRSR